MIKHLIPSVAIAVAVLLAPSARSALPTIACSADQVLECTSSNGASAIVQVTVADADGDGLMVIWDVNGVTARTDALASGTTSNGVTLSLTNQFGFGTNKVTVGVTDDGVNVIMCETLVVVRDTEPPVITSIKASPNLLWPPNHKMRTVGVIVEAHDECGPVTWQITSIDSSEPDDGTGDGHTTGDTAIAGPHKAKVRAERSGQGSGRVYTIHIVVTDLSNNSATGTVEVVVPHDKGRRHWRDRDDDADDGKPGKGKGRGKGKGHGN
jgi:hypothetical protein